MAGLTNTGQSSDAYLASMGDTISIDGSGQSLRLNIDIPRGSSLNISSFLFFLSNETGPDPLSHPFIFLKFILRFNQNLAPHIFHKFNTKFCFG